MRSLKLTYLVAALTVSANTVVAQTGTTHMTFNTAPGVGIGSTIASPYKATWTGTTIAPSSYPAGSIDIFCVDLLDNVGYGQQWNANTQNLGAVVNTSILRWGGEADPLLKYRQAAWLADQFAGKSGTVQKELQTAIWRIFTPAAVDGIPNGTAYGDLSVNYANVLGWQGSSLTFANAHALSDSYWDKFVIISDQAMTTPLIESAPGVGDWHLSRGTQEFITISPVPEPASLALLGTGLVGLLTVTRRRKR